MQKRPIGSNLNFNDGEWIVPYGLLALSMFYWDYQWSKVVLIVMMFISFFHIMHEHRLIFGKVDVNKRRMYNLGAFAMIAALRVKFILPVYVAISYATFASQLKKDGDERLFQMKKKTYIWMMSILLFAMFLDTIQGLMLLDDYMAALQAQQPSQGIPVTISQ
jgi:hypothetical protein